MHRNEEDTIKLFISKYRNKCFALSNWNNLKDRGYSMKEMLNCIYNAAKGSTEEMANIIDHLASKRKVFGRSQVYSEMPINKVDLIRQSDGTLKLDGYNPNDSLPLKGQHVERNRNIFRKSDDQTSKTYMNAVDRINDLGEEVRKLYPNETNEFITSAMQAIKEYASKRKINTDKVIQGLRKKRYKINTFLWKVVPNIQTENMNRFNSNKRKVIIINESDFYRLQENMQMTEHKFHQNIRLFISQLLQDPVNAQPSELLKENGCKRGYLIATLLKYHILEKQERISDKDADGNPKTATMLVKYKCPKKDFDRKIEKLYIRLFEKNLPPRQNHNSFDNINEEGEGGCAMGGATSAESSGQFIAPLGMVTQGKKQQKDSEIEESTTTMSVGDYSYDLPFGGDKESLARKNGKGGSVSVNET